MPSRELPPCLESGVRYPARPQCSGSQPPDVANDSGPAPGCWRPEAGQPVSIAAVTAHRGWPHSEMTANEFAQLGLSEPILRALQARDYSTPTPIQTRAIPHLLEDRDLLGIAQTGTGKTAAFAL